MMWHGGWRALGLGCFLTIGSIVAAEAATAQQPSRVRFRMAPDSTVVQEIHLRDGTKLVGRIVRLEGDRVFFQTLGNIELEFPRRDVARLREVTGTTQRGEFWPDDPSDSRLFLAPTARVPGHGHGYFGIYELVVPSFAVGIGNIAMISGGMSIVPGIALDDQVFYIAPKIQVFDLEYVQGAVGAFWVGVPDEEGSVGLLYGGVTGGTAIAAVTAGLAFPFASGEGVAEDQPILVLGAEARGTRNLKLITENWISPGEGSILSFGVRILASRLTVEAALTKPTGQDYVFPLVNFSLAW